MFTLLRAAAGAAARRARKAVLASIPSCSSRSRETPKINLWEPTIGWSKELRLTERALSHSLRSKRKEGLGGASESKALCVGGMGSLRQSRAAQATVIVALLALACVPSGAGDWGTPSRGQDPGSGEVGADGSGQGRGGIEGSRDEKSCISACTPEGTCNCIPIPR